jgi:O-6-methylguanine DNA methyltransferase
MKKTFKQRVVDIVSRIPKGETMTYHQVAEKAGSPKAARAVGSIMSKNKDMSVPCHRVIRKDGKIGEYNGLRGSSKKELLSGEGAL